MNFFNASEEYVIGIDEAGRGAIAGPVVCAACTFLTKDAEFCKKYIKDSKKLSPKQRDFAKDHLKINTAFEIGMASVEEIEEMNILNATMLAMTRAAQKLISSLPFGSKIKVIVDGNKSPNSEYISIVKGDDKFFEISAASIFAKTHRDAFMTELSVKYPKYGFNKHFGYGTKAHFNSIKTFGLSEIHRKSWVKIEKYNPEGINTTLF